MSAAPLAESAPSRSRRLFGACLGIALAVHLLTLALLRNETFFGMAAIREGARQLFRVPVSHVPPPRPRPSPLQLPRRAEVLAAVQADVAGVVADALAKLPRATFTEPPPSTQLEAYAQARKAKTAPVRLEQPTHLDAVRDAAALAGQGVVRETVQVVSRRADSSGDTQGISAGTVQTLQRSGPVATAAVAGRAPSVPTPIPAVPRPLPPPQPVRRTTPPPLDEIQIARQTREVLDPIRDRPDDAWEAYFDFRLTVYRPQPDQPGYFRFDALPKHDVQLPVAVRSVLFALDASKSMGQDRFGQAREVFGQAVDALPPGDRFTVVAFQSRASWWSRTFRDATAVNKHSAMDWVERLAAEGRTDLYRGLAPALASIEPENRPVLVLLCSDGRPTAGERDSRVLINELTAQLGGRASIFAYGAGSNVNRYLLDLLTYLNRGAATFGTEPQDMAPGLSAMEHSIREPVYLRPQILMANSDPESLFPRTLPDIYTGRALRLWGRLEPGATRVGVRLQGWSQGRPREILTELNVPAADNGDRRLAQAWAYQKLFYMVGELTAGADDPILAAAVADLGRAYDLPQEYVEAARGR